MKFIYTFLTLYLTFLKFVRNDNDIASLLSDLIKNDYKSSNVQAYPESNNINNFNLNSDLMSQSYQENPYLG
jgi:hypothetical protein